MSRKKPAVPILAIIVFMLLSAHSSSLDAQTAAALYYDNQSPAQVSDNLKTDSKVIAPSESIKTQYKDEGSPLSVPNTEDDELVFRKPMDSKDSVPLITEVKVSEVLNALRVSFKGLSGVLLYHLQLASDPEFKNVVREKRIIFESDTLSGIKKGTYYFRYRGCDEWVCRESSQAWSEVARYDVGQDLPEIREKVTAENRNHKRLALVDRFQKSEAQFKRETAQVLEKHIGHAVEPGQEKEAFLEFKKDPKTTAQQLQVLKKDLSGIRTAWIAEKRSLRKESRNLVLPR